MTPRELKDHCDLVIKLLEARKEGKKIECKLSDKWVELGSTERLLG